MGSGQIEERGGLATGGQGGFFYRKRKGLMEVLQKVRVTVVPDFVSVEQVSAQHGRVWPCIQSGKGITELITELSTLMSSFFKDLLLPNFLVI